jgi:flagellar hook assembly protein FlgD
VELDIYSASGRLVRRLRDLPSGAGVQEAYWDARDAEGRRVANGVLFIRMTARLGDDVKRSLGKLAVTR